MFRTLEEYENYLKTLSFEQLDDICCNIDREAFPERFELVEKYYSAKKSEEESIKEREMPEVNNRPVITSTNYYKEMQRPSIVKIAAVKLAVFVGFTFFIFALAMVKACFVRDVCSFNPIEVYREEPMYIIIAVLASVVFAVWILFSDMFD